MLNMLHILTWKLYLFYFNSISGTTWTQHKSSWLKTTYKYLQLCPFMHDQQPLLDMIT